MALPPSPATAFRIDLAVGTPTDQKAGAWLRAASELRMAARARGASRQQYLYEALAVAIEHYGDDVIDNWALREYGNELGFVEALMYLAHDALEERAHNLAAVLLDDLLSAAQELTPLHRGRLLLLRARASWKVALLEDSLDRYREVERLGEEHGRPELVARACNGMTTLAQIRGNYPEMREHAVRAATIADAEGLPAVSRMAHHALMMLAGRDKRFEEALREGARVLELSRGHDEWEAEILQSFGQLLLEMGRPDGARACFAAVTTLSTRTQVIMPSLGGLAMASAITGREPTLEWAVREVWSMRESGSGSYPIAEALLECGMALARLGRHEEARRYVGAAESIATSFNFHEIAHRAQQAPTTFPAPPRAPALAEASETLVAMLCEMEPVSLPDHVTLETAR